MHEQYIHWAACKPQNMSYTVLRVGNSKRKTVVDVVSGDNLLPSYCVVIGPEG